MVDDQSPHDPSRISHESSAVGKRRAIACGHIQIGFMQEGGGTKAGGQALSSEFTLGQSMQLGIKGRKQRLCGGPVTLFGCDYKRRERRPHGFLPASCHGGTLRQKMEKIL